MDVTVDVDEEEQGSASNTPLTYRTRSARHTHSPLETSDEQLFSTAAAAQHRPLCERWAHLPNTALLVLLAVAVVVYAVRTDTRINELEGQGQGQGREGEPDAHEGGGLGQVYKAKPRVYKLTVYLRGFEAVPSAVVNPVLRAHVGDSLRLHVRNGENVPHNTQLDIRGVVTTVRGRRVQPEEDWHLRRKGDEVELFVPRLHQAGVFLYYSSVGNQQDAGVVGRVVVTEPGDFASGPDTLAAMPPVHPDAVDIVHRPEKVPPPINIRYSTRADGQPCTVSDWAAERRAGGGHVQRCAYPLPDDPAHRARVMTHNRTRPARHEITLVSKEVIGWLEPNVSALFWTYNGSVPGPMLRVRVGDYVYLRFINPPGDHTMFHSVDLHAVAGQGGGAGGPYQPGLSTSKGESVVYFRASTPGLFLYHCASNYIPQHISLGMYGLILVEPLEGLPFVHKELYLVQGSVYTEFPAGARSGDGVSGHQRWAPQNEVKEDAQYYVWNGAFHSLLLGTGVPAGPVFAGDFVRMFVGNSGVNGVSSFHVIGESFDRVWREADLTRPPALNVQTTVIPAGGAVVATTYVDVPGQYLLTDHALTRTMRKGLAGTLVALDPAAGPLPASSSPLSPAMLAHYNDTYKAASFFGVCGGRQVDSDVKQQVQNSYGNGTNSTAWQCGDEATHKAVQALMHQAGAWPPLQRTP